ncbi:MAG: leucine-rich repeat domain-containing protein [Dehalococcoidia bacterium]
MLHIGNNQIVDISPLSGLINLVRLNLMDNQVSDLSPLSGLTNMTLLWLWDNQVTDLSPLVANRGIGAGDRVWLHGNPLDLSPGSQNMRHIEDLRRRWVSVHVRL